MTLIPRSIYEQGNAKPISSLGVREFQTVGGTVTAHIDRLGISTTVCSKETYVGISDSPVRLLGADYFEGTIFTVDADNESIYLHSRSQSIGPLPVK